MATCTITGLAHIGIMTADMERSIDFYTRILNFTCYNRQNLGDTELAFLRAGSCEIELVAPADGTGINERRPGQVDHVAMEVTNLDEDLARLEEAGVVLSSPAGKAALFANGVRNVFFAGPSGERLELFQYL